MAYTRQLSTDAAWDIITRIRGKELSYRQAASLHGVGKDTIWKLVTGRTYKDVMRSIDPSSCAPSFHHHTVSNVCPTCQHSLAVAVNRVGQAISYCPTCG